MGQNKKSFTVNGFYKGADDHLYLFEDDEGENLEFDLCAENVFRKFDLNGTKEIGQNFIITYQIKDEDEHEEVELEIINMDRS